MSTWTSSLRSLRDKVLECRLVYGLWQAPFAEAKLAPVLANNDLSQVRRVLDVGCGPGTNSHHFLGTNYLGIDINEDYINHAKSRYAGKFMVADVTKLRLADEERFDFVLINSLLHHLTDTEVRELLRKTADVLTDDGHVHILELVLPERTSVARCLARLDRGQYPRPLDDWRSLLSEVFRPALCQTYVLDGLGVALWNMVYFKGQPRR